MGGGQNLLCSVKNPQKATNKGGLPTNLSTLCDVCVSYMLVYGCNGNMTV